MKHNNHGLTLIELVISIALVSVILLTAVTALSFGRKSFSALDRQGDLQSQAANILLQIASQVRECRGIQAAPDTSVLSLEGKDGKSIKFQWDGAKTLTYAVEGSAPQILSTQVREIVFTTSGDGVDIRLILQSQEETLTLKDYIHRR